MHLAEKERGRPMESEVNSLIISYSLYGSETDSASYYRKIVRLAKEIQKLLTHTFEKQVLAYQKWITLEQIEVVRTKAEYELELLMLGIFWLIYGARARTLSPFSRKLLIGAAKMRRHMKKAKPIWSWCKGKLSRYYLVENTKIKQEAQASCSLEQLINWLEATGEYEEECLRLKNWAKFIKTLEEKNVAQLMEQVISAAQLFSQKTEQDLRPYLAGVEHFIKQNELRYRGREDYIFCMQPTLLYKFNLVGAQILNETYRKAFLETKKKVVFLPACMTKRGPLCQGALDQGGYKCQECTQGCPVYEAKRIAQCYGAQTTILYHESQLNRQKVSQKEGPIGVIGVACILNLVSGGFKAKRLGYVPQCVLLDYCGCKQHWHEKGIVTNINEEQLRRTLGRE